MLYRESRGFQRSTYAEDSRVFRCSLTRIAYYFVPVHRQSGGDPVFMNQRLLVNSLFPAFFLNLRNRGDRLKYPGWATCGQVQSGDPAAFMAVGA